MTPDTINGCFEIVGAAFLSTNVYALYKDKTLAGVKIPPTAFFSLWGLWNLYYYPTLDQWFSFVGGIAIVFVNGVWVGLAIYYSKFR